MERLARMLNSCVLVPLRLSAGSCGRGVDLVVQALTAGHAYRGVCQGACLARLDRHLGHGALGGCAREKSHRRRRGLAGSWSGGENRVSARRPLRQRGPRHVRPPQRHETPSRADTSALPCVGASRTRARAAFKPPYTHRACTCRDAPRLACVSVARPAQGAHAAHLAQPMICEHAAALAIVRGLPCQPVAGNPALAAATVALCALREPVRAHSDFDEFCSAVCLEGASAVERRRRVAVAGPSRQPGSRAAACRCPLVRNPHASLARVPRTHVSLDSLMHQPPRSCLREQLRAARRDLSHAV